MKLAAGTVLQNGKYLLNHALGRESFSMTYRATQNDLQHPVVIKTLHPSLKASVNFARLQERFIEVTRQLARNQHPSVVRIVDFFEEGGLPFMVMEYVPGNTMAEVIQAGGRILKPEAVHYARQLGGALRLIHDRGLYHGNIKPQNIVRRQGTNLAVLVGFGISHELTLARSTAHEYSAPERTTVPQPTPAIDLYGLSATLSYMLTGYPLGAQDLSPAALTSDSLLERAIVQGLARDPHRRPPTISAWLELLPADTLPLMPPQSHVKPGPPSAIVPPPAVPRQPAPPPLNRMATTQGQQRALAAPPPAVPAQRTPPPLAGTPANNGYHAATAPFPAPRTVTAKGIPSSRAVQSDSVGSMTLWTFLGQPRVLRMLGLLTAVAAAIGVGFGLALRFSAAKSPGFSFLNPNQPFPERPWKGTKSPTMTQSDIPVERSGGISDVMDPLGDVEPVERKGDRTRHPERPQPSPPTVDPAVERDSEPAPSTSEAAPPSATAAPEPEAPTNPAVTPADSPPRPPTAPAKAEPAPAAGSVSPQ